MKIVRFLSDNSEPKYGLVRDDLIYSLIGSITGSFSEGELVGPLKLYKLLAPCEPTKVICAAVNFPGTSHFDTNMEEPLFFVKPKSSVTGTDTEVKNPFPGKRWWGEAELGFVIKKQMKNISEENVKDYDILKTQIHNIVLDESTFDKKIVIDLNGTRAETIDSTCSQLIDAKIIRYHKNPVEKLNLCLNFIDKLLYFIDGQLLDKGNLTDVTDTFSITLKYTKERLIKLPHHLLNLPYESVFDKYYPITESRTGGGGYDKTNINRRNQRNIRQYKSKNKIRRTKKNKTHRRYRGT